MSSMRRDIEMKKNMMIALFILTPVLFFACTSENPEAGKNGNTGAAEAEQTQKEITVTAAQFEMAKMELGKITRQVFSERIQVTGMMDVPPEYKADVSVYYGGTVKDVRLLVGQDVQKGQVLFILENPGYVQMQQDYLNAKSRLSYLKTEYERQKELFKEFQEKQ